MSEGYVVRVRVESSCGGRQGQGFVARDTLRIRVEIDRNRVFVERFTLFQTRIKGLTSLV